jgi:hypothetical protein
MAIVRREGGESNFENNIGWLRHCADTGSVNIRRWIDNEVQPGALGRRGLISPDVVRNDSVGIHNDCIVEIIEPVPANTTRAEFWGLPVNCTERPVEIASGNWLSDSLGIAPVIR